MRVTINEPIAAAKLPPEIRGTLPAGSIVRVSYEVLLTGNGLTPQEEAEILQAGEDAEHGLNLYGPFESAEAMIASLHAESDKPDDE